MRTRFLRLPDRLINISEILEIVEVEGPYPQNKKSRIIMKREGFDYIEVDIPLKELALMLEGNRSPLPMSVRAGM